MRKLSWFLRHGLPESGLTYDDIGGSPIKDVATYLNVSVSTITDAVATDNKNRYGTYTNNQGTAMIRAYQGHSFPISLDAYTRIDSPDYFPPGTLIYHGTSTKALNSIMDDGLIKPMSRSAVHFHTHKPTAIQVGTRHGNPAILAFHPTSLPYPLYLAGNGVLLSPTAVQLTTGGFTVEFINK